MNIAIITSNSDRASVNIRQNLIDSHGFRNYNAAHSEHNIKIHEFDEELILLDGIDKKISADIFIFASKHVSKAGIDSFSVHSPGNWGAAEHGGRERQLCFAPAALIKSSLKCLKRNEMGVQVFQEATHHGPFLEKPVMFIEIGSNEKMYGNKAAGKVVADAIMNSVGSLNSELRVAVGIGGPHYCPNFSRIMLETDVSAAHVCPKHMLESLDEEMLFQALNRTVPKAEMIILDWKGLGNQKERIKRFITVEGIQLLRIGDF